MTEKELRIPESTFERENKKRSLIVTLVVHFCVLLPALFFITCSGPAEPELTEIMWGGSGGDPSVNAPEGETPKGSPDADPETTNVPTPEQTAERPTRQTQRDTRNPDLPASERPTQENSDEQQTESTTNESQTQTDKPEQTDDIRGSEDGTGDTPAGGSGGQTVGSTHGGIGTRGWIRTPNATAPPGTSQVGEVILQFTVLPNGEVTNVIPRKRASATLTSLAINALSRAKARPLPPSAEQKPLVYTITYKFVLN